MRITDLDVLTLGTAERDLVFVRLRTDQGLIGLGEAGFSARPGPLRAFLEVIGPRHVVGADPFETERLIAGVLRDEPGRVGAIVASALAGVEIACWDLVGKALGVPVYRLLGGAVRDRIKACAGGWHGVERTPDAFATAARRAVAKGYRALRLDPFGDAPRDPSLAERHEAIRLAESVRAAVGPDVEVSIAMQGRFIPDAAVRIARALERIEPRWIEDPVPAGNPQALARAARQIRVPVATGEGLRHRSDCRELFGRLSCDLIQPDLTCGCGLSEQKKIAAMAETHAIQVALRNQAGPVATAAALHLAATLPNVILLEHVDDFAAEEILRGGPNSGLPGNPAREAVEGGPIVVDGHFPLPQGPGLGVALHEDVVRAHPCRSTSSVPK
ncbi:MAG: mandelate racemase/muconate lactonizing enzyme family protein [Planctomycetaceae bacterium]|nr:mandelate racemase/muconate lactonizing enzyme family protein [Planctomycetaceae bacterium]